ncbi:MAG: hypothetical protein OXD45_12150 [Rhodobacteraceae bacterium]|nr:hypothetical protein [Paracoccaceae bacterium]MCY4307497.1 hypothetical protein [Paracoccaceae bacterium]
MRLRCSSIGLGNQTILHALSPSAPPRISSKGEGGTGNRRGPQPADPQQHCGLEPSLAHLTIGDDRGAQARSALPKEMRSQSPM